MTMRQVVEHASQQVDKALDRVPLPAHAAANVSAAVVAEALQWDWLRILTIVLIVVQIVYWLDKLGRQWKLWGKSDEQNE